MSTSTILKEPIFITTIKKHIGIYLFNYPNFALHGRIDWLSYVPSFNLETRLNPSVIEDIIIFYASKSQQNHHGSFEVQILLDRLITLDYLVSYDKDRLIKRLEKSANKIKFPLESGIMKMIRYHVMNNVPLLLWWQPEGDGCKPEVNLFYHSIADASSKLHK